MKYTSTYNRDTVLEVEEKDSKLRFNIVGGMLHLSKETINKLITDLTHWYTTGKFKPQGKSYKATFANGYQTTIKGDKFTYVLSQISDDKQYRGKGGLVKLEVCNC